jgi:hypothetical protein
MWPRSPRGVATRCTPANSASMTMASAATQIAAPTTPYSR